MNKVSACWKKTIIAIASILTCSNFVTTNKLLANPTTGLKTIEPIEIYVPPPEKKSLGICSHYLNLVVNNVIDRPPLNRGKWGILVQTLEGKTLYYRNPDSYLIPASNLKLLVTAAALQKLNPSGLIRSKSIREWILETNLSSNNQYADILLRYLGGSQSVQKILTDLGIDSRGYRLRDGSGLSRKNLATPRTIVATLQAMHSAPNNDIFLASLPVAGTRGTLKNRLRFSTTQGHVYAKTGTLRGVRSLSGYLEHPDYEAVVFSIITNQPTNQSGSILVEAIDKIVLLLSSMITCS
ncbi:MAG: D-alanyl-D-alanine carboxypeptidase/D-alanyl-D-alanine-endopeptidase [Xenococcaceae cyanobacterium]